MATKVKTSPKQVLKSKNGNKKPQKTVSEYHKKVIQTNQNLKGEFRTLGGCLKQMWFFRDEMKLDEAQKSIVKLLREDETSYKEFKKHCRTSKKGNYSVFFVLQAIYKSLKPETKQAKKTAKKKEEATAKKRTPIKQKTVKELKAIAKSNKIIGYSKMKKEQLIEALTKKK